MSNKLRSFSILLFPVLCFLLILPACGPTPTPTPTVLPTITQIPTETPTTLVQPTIEIPTQTPYIITATIQAVTVTSPPPQGVFFLSLEEGGYFHLYAYSPQTLPLTRLTADAWDDISPALSPDGHWLAFSSHRNGYWDLYLMDLGSGGLLRLTDTLEYDAAPSWSPDGAYIAYESYVSGNMEIMFRSVSDPTQPPTQLTQNPAADTSPAWSPLGRQIAFISNRSGEPEVWIADLDHAGNSIDVSNNPLTAEAHPAWSPDGTMLAWAANDPDSGLSSIYLWDARNPNSPARWAGSGNWPVWQDNNTIASRLPAPNQTFLSAFTITGEMSLPPVQLPGDLNGISFGITSAVLPGSFQQAAQTTFSAPFLSSGNSQPAAGAGQASLISLSNVTAAYPQLSEFASDSFQALRYQVIAQTGWDALGNLENAYVPLTAPLDPGLIEDWLSTGRAFTLNPVLVQVNWMTVVREDFGQQTYWRIFLRAAAQDGSQGMPLTQVPWDFSARTTSSSAYENGGQLMNSIPGGYWIDLTTLAAQYGWERLPALTNWRTYYAGARFNELAYTQGLDWRTAMLQLYPPEILVTPTIVIPPTRTPTRTPLWYRTPTPTRTATARPTSTP